MDQAVEEFRAERKKSSAELGMSSPEAVLLVTVLRGTVVAVVEGLEKGGRTFEDVCVAHAQKLTMSSCSSLTEPFLHFGIRHWDYSLRHKCESIKGREN